VLNRRCRPPEQVEVQRDRLKSKERRDSSRMVANFECLCSGFKRKGSGVLTDISHSGAMVEDASFVPVRGELIGLSIDLPVTGACLMIGWVTRHTPKGFAIEFDESSPEAKRLATDIAAIVPVRSKPDRSSGG
jgi:hypothetical protein